MNQRGQAPPKGCSEVTNRLHLVPLCSHQLDDRPLALIALLYRPSWRIIPFAEGRSSCPPTPVRPSVHAGPLACLSVCVCSSVDSGGSLSICVSECAGAIPLSRARRQELQPTDR